MVDPEMCYGDREGFENTSESWVPRQIDAG